MNRGQDNGHLRLRGTLLCGLLVAVASMALLSTSSQVAKAESPFGPLLEPGVTCINLIPNTHTATTATQSMSHPLCRDRAVTVA